VANVVVFVFVVTNMFSVGLGLSLSQILTPLRSVRLVTLSLVANFLFVPLTAYIITRSIVLSETTVVTILLLATAAGAPILPKLAAFARGNVGYSVALTVVLLATTVAYMPAVMPFLLPGMHVSRWAVAKPLVTVLLIPLVIGLFARARRTRLAARLEPYFARLSTLALMVALVLIALSNYDQVLRIDIRALGAALVFMSISFITGLLLGGPTPGTRTVLAFGTAQRDLSAALLVAMDNFPNREVVVMLTVFALLGASIQIPIALALGRRTGGSLKHG